MSHPLASPPAYAAFIYDLPNRYPAIQRSSLVYIPLGSLVSTHPHHKHIHPDIKHNRIPAPNLTFTGPNLPFLIEEVEQVLSSKSA